MGSNYFFGSMGEPFGNKFLHRIDYELSQAKNPKKIINGYYNQLVQYLNSERRYDADYAKAWANTYKSYIEDYGERRTELFDAFKQYLNK